MVVNDCRAVMAPVAPSGETGTPVPMQFVDLMMALQIGLQVVNRTIEVLAGTRNPAAVPVKFLNRGFIPFLKIPAAILMALADSIALGP